MLQKTEAKFHHFQYWLSGHMLLTTFLCKHSDRYVHVTNPDTCSIGISLCLLKTFSTIHFEYPLTISVFLNECMVFPSSGNGFCFWVQTEWHFSTSHGKGVCHGVHVCGTVKCITASVSLYRPYVDKNMTHYQLFQWASKSVYTCNYLLLQ